MTISCKTLSKKSKMPSYRFCTLLHELFRYDFEYEDGDEEETGDVGIENKYYNAKQLKEDNPDEAIDEFLGLPALEQEKGDWLGT